jgi:MMP 1-O-methyltransferase
VGLPPDIEQVIARSWESTVDVPGFLGENEARFLALAAACIPAHGAIVEIGSFKGRSTVMLAKLAAHYGLGPIVSIDPHTRNLSEKSGSPSMVTSTYEDFLHSLRQAGVEEQVEVHREYSQAVSRSWTRPIRLLWIDGDHSYQGAKEDFLNFAPYLSPMGVVAFHDALNNFPGPIQVYVENVLRTDKFGPTGFVQSIAWAQFRPTDSASFTAQRQSLERKASRLIPFVERNTELRGLSKIFYKLNRSRVPRTLLPAAELHRLLND